MASDKLTHCLCRQDFETIEEFNRHVGAAGPPDCAVLIADLDRALRKAGRDCGCEPGWRCVKHAKMAKNGHADKASEAVVNQVYGWGFVTQDGGTGNSDFSEIPCTPIRANADGFVTQGGRPRTHRSNAEKQRAYRRRKRP